MPKKIIGRIDKADFPLLDLYDIDIKIDTGAYTSSIHCHKVLVDDNDELICIFYDEGHPYYNGKEIRFKEYRFAKVKSSNGVSAIQSKTNCPAIKITVSKISRGKIIIKTDSKEIFTW